MASLVADYGSESENSSSSCISNETIEDSSGKSNSTDQVSRIKNFFAEDVDSDVSDNDEETLKEDSLDNESPSIKLPNPLASASQHLPSAGDSVEGSSVFRNQFIKAEQAKWSVLEQHVRMTNPDPVQDTKKKVCKAYKRGMCRSGRKCRFLHPSDVILPQTNTDTGTDGEPATTTATHGYYGQQTFHEQVPDPDQDDDSYMGQAKRKYRAGIRDCLKPPKKAMITLDKERATERPWTQL